LLRALIMNPELAFSTRRNRLFVVDKPEGPSITLPFGSINLVVFRNAMAIGEPPVDVEEIAERVVVRAGRSSGYGDTGGFAGCK